MARSSAAQPLRKRLRFRSYDGSSENGEPMSEWRDEINRKALARLTLALPAVFPRPALIHALGRRFTPPMPPLAIDSYLRGPPRRAQPLPPPPAARPPPPPRLAR